MAGGAHAGDWLSRVALPATYVVIYSLAALMPSLPVMKGLRRNAQDAAGQHLDGGAVGTFLVAGPGRLVALAATIAAGGGGADAHQLRGSRVQAIAIFCGRIDAHADLMFDGCSGRSAWGWHWG